MPATPTSKDELQPELKLARRTCVEKASEVVGTEDTAWGTRKIGVVEQVENLGPEFQPSSFTNHSVLEQGEVNSAFPGLEDEISSGIAEGKGLRHFESLRIEPAFRRA